VARRFTQSRWTFPLPTDGRQVCGYVHHDPDTALNVLYVFGKTDENLIDVVGVHVFTETDDDIVRKMLLLESRLPQRSTGIRTVDIRANVGGAVLRKALAELRNRDERVWPFFHPADLVGADRVVGDPGDVNDDALTHARLAVRYADMIASGVSAPRRELAQELGISEDGLKSRLSKATKAGMWIPSRGRRFGSASDLAYRTVDQAQGEDR